MRFLYVFRDDPNRQLLTDVEWAILRFERRFDTPAEKILVHPSEENLFVGVPLPVKVDSKIQIGYFGVK